MSRDTAETRTGAMSTVLWWLRQAVRRWKLLTFMPPIVAVAVVLLSLVRGIPYTAESAFTPQSSEVAASRFAGLAAQFGIGFPMTSGTGTIQFYAALLRSRQLLEAVALTEYPTGDSTTAARANLIEILDAEGDTGEERLKSVVDQLEDLVTISLGVEANLVRLYTTAPTPELAVAINGRMLTLVNDFNRETLQSQAAAEREFIEDRLRTAQEELAAAEAELRRFFEENRTYLSSPQLAFEAARLQRVVDLRQQIYVSLAQAYEQARIDEVRNTPLITVVEAPERSARPAASIALRAILGLFLGTVLALVALVAWTFWQERVGLSAADLKRVVRDTLKEDAVANGG